MPNRLPVLPPPPKISEVSAELSDLLVDRPICRTADLKSIRLQSVSIGSGWNNELPPPPPLLRAPMRTCHAQSIGGSGDAAHLRLRLTTRSPLEMQARLQRPPFPPLLLWQARFARQFSAFGVLIYLHTHPCKTVQFGVGRDRKCVLTIMRAGTRCRVGDTFETMLRAGSFTALTSGMKTQTLHDAAANRAVSTKSP